MEEHHIWCNKQQGPVDTCKQCARLFEQYPIVEGDKDGKQLASIYFPELEPISKLQKIENTDDV